MNHYEVRQYPGWHHQMVVCMLAHFFLWHVKIRLGKKAPALTLPQLRTLTDSPAPLRRPLPDTGHDAGLLD
jgi:hypothetical protein